MLSYIVRITLDFQKQHGYPPNTLILGRHHFARIHGEYADADVADLFERLGVNLLLSEEDSHPRVGWYDQIADRKTSIGS